jgi:hypothetical protein
MVSKGIITWGSIGTTIPATDRYYGGAQSIDGSYSLFFANLTAGGTVYYKVTQGVGPTMALTTYAAPPGTPNSSWAYGIVQLDGTFYMMDSTGAIFGSNVNDPQTWNAANLIQANAVPGRGVAIYRQLAYLLAFKEYDVEIFYDAGNATGSPLSPVQSARLAVGTQYPYSIAQIETKVFFVSQAMDGEISVSVIDNLTLTRISTPAVDRVLAAFAQGNTNIYNITAACVKVGGHRLYLLKIQNSQSFCYDMDTQVWSEWDMPGFEQFLPATVPYQGQSFALTDTGPVNLRMDAASDFGGTPVIWSLISPSFDGGTRNWKYLPRMDFLVDNTPAQDLLVRWSDDDQVSWSSWRAVNLASSRPSLVNCGRFRRRTFHFYHSGPQPLRLQAVDLHLEEGTL